MSFTLPQILHTKGARKVEKNICHAFKEGWKLERLSLKRFFGAKIRFGGLI
jgi:hypothetical protein